MTADLDATLSAASSDTLRQVERLDERAPRRAFVDATGCTWHYRRIGGGQQAVFLLPGAGGTSQFFFQQAAAEDPNVSLFLIDYPGEPDAVQLADGIAALWDVLGVERASFVGCSYSAYWGQIVAQRHPDRIDRLALCNGFTDASDLAGNPLFDHEAIRTAAAGALREQWLERSKSNPHPALRAVLVGAMREWLPAEDLKGRLLRVSRSVPVGRLPLAAGQVLVLDCADDPLVPATARDRFAQGHSDFRRVTLTSGGHYPYVIAPEAFGQAVGSFLQIRNF